MKIIKIIELNKRITQKHENLNIQQKNNENLENLKI